MHINICSWIVYDVELSIKSTAHKLQTCWTGRTSPGYLVLSCVPGIFQYYIQGVLCCYSDTTRIIIYDIPLCLVYSSSTKRRDECESCFYFYYFYSTWAETELSKLLIEPQGQGPGGKCDILEEIAVHWLKLFEWKFGYKMYTLQICVFFYYFSAPRVQQQKEHFLKDL